MESKMALKCKTWISTYIPSEHQECLYYYEWCCLNPLLRRYIIKNVNEGKRSIITAMLLKRIGLRPGLPDYHLALPNDRYCGLWLEMKKIDGRNTGKNKKQDDWIKKLNYAGHYATYSYGWEDAADITTKYISTIPLQTIHYLIS